MHRQRPLSICMATGPDSDDLYTGGDKNRPRSSLHTRSNSVSFEVDNNDHNHEHATLYRGPSSASHYTNTRPVPRHRVNSSSIAMNDSAPSTSRHHHTTGGAGKTVGGSKRKRTSARKVSSTRRDVRTMDYGLGLLDDPSFLGE